MSWWYRRERNHASGKKVKRNRFLWKLLILFCRTLRKTVTGRQLHKLLCWQHAVYAQTLSWSSPALNRKELGFNGRSMYLCSESCVPLNSSAHREWPKRVHDLQTHEWPSFLYSGDHQFHSFPLLKAVWPAATIELETTVLVPNTILGASVMGFMILQL